MSSIDPAPIDPPPTASVAAGSVLPVPEQVAGENPSAKSDSQPDEQFLSDLTAANRLKGFLLGSGTDIQKDVLDGLARLTFIYSQELEDFEKRIRTGEIGKKLWSPE